jgi:hypothetical protein
MSNPKRRSSYGLSLVILTLLVLLAANARYIQYGGRVAHYETDETANLSTQPEPEAGCIVFREEVKNNLEIANDTDKERVLLTQFNSSSHILLDTIHLPPWRGMGILPEGSNSVRLWQCSDKDTASVYKHSLIVHLLETYTCGTAIADGELIGRDDDLLKYRKPCDEAEALDYIERYKLGMVQPLP